MTNVERREVLTSKLGLSAVAPGQRRVGIVVECRVSNSPSSDFPPWLVRRGRGFEYGHPKLHSEAIPRHAVPTWFRLLSLALIGRALPAGPLARIPWHFVRCPGYQFWAG